VVGVEEHVSEASSTVTQRAVEQLLPCGDTAEGEAGARGQAAVPPREAVTVTAAAAMGKGRGGTVKGMAGEA
jgi:hypothetical protein